LDDKFFKTATDGSREQFQHRQIFAILASREREMNVLDARGRIKTLEIKDEKLKSRLADVMLD